MTIGAVIALIATGFPHPLVAGPGRVRAGPGKVRAGRRQSHGRHHHRFAPVPPRTPSRPGRRLAERQLRPAIFLIRPGAASPSSRDSVAEPRRTACTRSGPRRRGPRSPSRRHIAAAARVASRCPQSTGTCGSDTSGLWTVPKARPTPAGHAASPLTRTGPPAPRDRAG
jgi:hypothetical protein